MEEEADGRAGGEWGWGGRGQGGRGRFLRSKRNLTA